MKAKEAEKIQKKKITKKSNRGKPSDLKGTRLDAPDIWTNKLESSEIVKFLAEEGRHLFLHQAGKHSKKQASSILIPFKGFYDRAEEVAKFLFSDSFASKRCLVYFFRMPDQSPLHNEELLQIRLKNQQHALILQYIQDLISPSFIEDLIHILNSELNASELTTEFLQSKNHFQDYSQIVKNEFIKHIIQHMKSTGNDESFSKDDEKTDIVYKRKIENEFFKFLDLAKTQANIISFIEKILSLFQPKNITQYDQNENVVNSGYGDQLESPDDSGDQSNQFSCAYLQNGWGMLRFNQQNTE